MRPLEVVGYTGSVEDILAGMFGPPQHDAHVERFKSHKWLTEMQAGTLRGLAAVNQFVADLREAEAERLAATFKFDIPALRLEHHRWTRGGFAGRPGADARARQLRRALEIAADRRDAMLQAAE